jgi:hypothetical protein
MRTELRLCEQRILPVDLSRSKNSALIAQRSALWLALCALLFALRVPAEAQQQAKVSKIGWLSARRAANIGQETIVGMLRDLGYVEGKNIAYEYRFADDKLDRLPALAEEVGSSQG